MASPIAVNVTTSVQLLWSGRNLSGNNTLLFINNDIVNTVMVGTDVTSLVIPIGPLGALSVDPTENWYVIGLVKGSEPVVVAPGGTTWTPSPAQVAASISALGLATATNQSIQNTSINNTPNSTAALIATGNALGPPGGVPLLRNTTQLGSATNQTIVANGSVNLVNNVTLNQPGFEAVFMYSFPANSGTIPFGQILLEWFDSATGNNIRTEAFFIPAGNNSQILCYICGPCYGDKLVLNFVNLDLAIAGTLTWVVNATSHVYLRSSIYQPLYQPQGVFGFSSPAGNPDTGMICATSPSIPASGTASRLMAAYGGRAYLNIDLNGSSAGVNVDIQDPLSLYSSFASMSQFRAVVTAGNQVYTEVALPNGPMLLNIHNTSSTAAVQPVVTIVRADY